MFEVPHEGSRIEKIYSGDTKHSMSDPRTSLLDVGCGDAMQRVVVGFYRDEQGHWAARLECGHSQHVRHDPPWMVREWVITAEGRAARIGSLMECKKCDEERAGH
jgi:hypothetical protein